MTIARAGDSGFLVFLDDPTFDELHSAAGSCREIPGVAAVIAGHASLLLVFNREVHDLDVRLIESNVEASRSRVGIAEQANHRIRVSVHRDVALDLDEFLAGKRLERSQFFERLSELRLRARYLGFRAGFAYLEGWPEEWSVPRRASARMRVAGGSFGVAGPLAAFYPIDSPGGWNILGRSDSRFWDPLRNPPNLIRAGDHVVVEPVMDALIFASDRSGAEPFDGEAIAEVVRPGQGTFIVPFADLRRLELGLPVGGPFDGNAAAAANQAVANEPRATVLECTMVGPSLLMRSERYFSWYGADVTIRCGGMEVRDPRQFLAREGELIEVERIRNGTRGWLAVEGGLAGDSRHEPSPKKLNGGDRLHGIEPVRRRARISSCHNEKLGILGVLAGPHEVDSSWLEQLFTAEWRVTSMFDRTGVRLEGPAPPGGIPATLPSCGMQFGSIQWQPGGELVIMGPDHPVTGGYLQPLTLRASERSKVAQLQSGDRVRFKV